MKKMAIIGFGAMGEWHFKNVSEKLPEIKIVGAFDINKESKNNIIKVGLKSYTNPQELYNDKEIEIVLIATPNDLHMPYSSECIKAGKNVICEKPVALNANELEKTIKLSQKMDVVFTVHQNRRWDADFLTIKKILEERILTEPFIIESRVQGSRRIMFGWRGNKKHGGGMVLDWGAHLVDQILLLLPWKVVSVSAHLHKKSSDEVEDNFTVLLRFENNLSVLLNVAMHCFITQPRWHMCCAEGTAIINDWNLNGKIIKLKNNDEDIGWGEEILAAGPTRCMAPRPEITIQTLPLPVVNTNWMEFYRNYLDVLNKKAELIVRPEQSLRVMKVIDAIFESENKSTWIKCNI